MAFTKLDKIKLRNSGVSGLPTQPTIPPQALKDAFDSPAKEVIAPYLDDLIDELEAGSAAKSLGAKAFDGADSNVQAELGKIRTDISSLDADSHTHANKEILDKITEDVVMDNDYVHTDNNYDDTEKGKVAENTEARHTHSNKAVLDKIDEQDGDLTYDGRVISGIDDSVQSEQSTYSSQKIVAITSPIDFKATAAINDAMTATRTANAATQRANTAEATAYTALDASLRAESEVSSVTDKLANQFALGYLGGNLFKKTNILNGFLENGVYKSSTTSFSFYAEVKPNTNYTVQKLSTSRFTMASFPSLPRPNEEGTFLGAHGTATQKKVTTGANDRILVIYGKRAVSDDAIPIEDIVNSIMVNEGTEYVDVYSEYSESNVELTKRLDDVFDGGFATKPLANKLTLISGAIDLSNPNVIGADSKRLATDILIELKPNTRYRVRAKGTNIRYYIVGWTSKSGLYTYNSNWQTAEKFVFDSGSCICARVGFGNLANTNISVSDVTEFIFEEYVQSNVELTEELVNINSTIAKVVETATIVSGETKTFELGVAVSIMAVSLNGKSTNSCIVLFCKGKIDYTVIGTLYTDIVVSVNNDIVSVTNNHSSLGLRVSYIK